MSFAETRLLYLLIIIPFAILLLWWVAFRRRQLLTRLGDGALVARLSALVNHNGRFIRNLLYVLALALTIVSLARPQWGFDEETVEQQGVQLMVALDVSPSMLAEDVAPNRLLRARQEIADLMDLLGGDEIGLVLFSGAAFIQFPLTTDYNTAKSFLDSATPSVISRPGTVLGEAILTAMSGFNAERTSQKVILILTDGEDHESDPLTAAQTAAADNVVIYTVGFGSERGEPIPLYNQLGQPVGFLQDNQGNQVLTRLDDAVLRQVASVTNGRYFQASSVGSLADDLARELDRLEQTSLESRTERIAIERFQIFLLVAVLSLFAIPLISERKSARRAASRQANQAILALVVMWLLSGCVSNEAQLLQDGNTAFEEAAYETAVAAYLDAESEAPDLAEPTYNIANTFYRQGGYEEAQSFLAASLEKARETVAQWSYFNQGNVAFQLGDAETAVSAYKDALRRNPADLDAKHNLELALQQLEQQEQQQQREQDQQQQTSEEEQEQQQGDDEGGESEETPEQQSEPQESQQSSEQPSESESAGSEQSEDSTETAVQPAEQLTEDQAIRLLEAIEQNTETLQEYLGLRFQGSSEPPDKGW